MGRPPIALVSAVDAMPLDTDLAVLCDALPEAVVVHWDDAEVRWDRYAAVFVRSPWDYVARRDSFVSWARRVEAVTTLWNPAALIEWNTDKHYLADLAARGIATVPTAFVATGAPMPPLTGDVVVKPAVGAGSQGAARFIGDPAGAAAHVRMLHAGGGVAMVQPYLDAVDTSGETALVYLGGRFSHAIRKGPILGSQIVWEGGGLFAREDVSPRDPSPEERALADRVLDAIPATAYARVDVVPTRDGPVVLELEVTEPSLFLHLDDGATPRAAAAFRRLAAATPA